jgi:hypothetical protein
MESEEDKSLEMSSSSTGMVLALRIDVPSSDCDSNAFLKSWDAWDSLAASIYIKDQYIIRASARKVAPVVFVNIHGVSNLAVVSFVFSFRLVRSVRQDLHRMRGRSVSCG